MNYSWYVLFNNNHFVKGIFLFYKSRATPVLSIFLKKEKEEE